MNSTEIRKLWNSIYSFSTTLQEADRRFQTALDELWEKEQDELFVAIKEEL